MDTNAPIIPIAPVPTPPAPLRSNSFAKKLVRILLILAGVGVALVILYYVAIYLFFFALFGPHSCPKYLDQEYHLDGTQFAIPDDPNTSVKLKCTSRLVSGSTRTRWGGYFTKHGDPEKDWYITIEHFNKVDLGNENGVTYFVIPFSTLLTPAIVGGANIGGMYLSLFSYDGKSPARQVSTLKLTTPRYDIAETHSAKRVNRGVYILIGNEYVIVSRQGQELIEIERGMETLPDFSIEPIFFVSDNGKTTEESMIEVDSGGNFSGLFNFENVGVPVEEPYADQSVDVVVTATSSNGQLFTLFDGIIEVGFHDSLDLYFDTDIPAGTYQTLIQVNPYKKIEESDYSNNSLEKTLVVPAREAEEELDDL